MKKEKSGIIFVLIAGILWGTMGVFVNYFNSVGLGSVECAWLRLVVAAVLVSLYILIKDAKLFSIKARDLWCFLGSGILSLMIFTVCYFRTIILSSMSVAAVLLYTSPIFVIILSMIFFKEKLTKIKALSAILCVIGCAFVTGIVGSDTKISILALLLGVSSGFAYALYSIFSRFALEKGYKSITILHILLY
ncbi:MAG: EamA family transporter, partial [Ruminococcaceae bacterium]|nr:EamA family transporter [Oscillospiraceae bacterium]